MFLTRTHAIYFSALLASLLNMSTPATSDEVAPEILDDYAYITGFNNLETLPAFSLVAPSGSTPRENFVSSSLGGITNTPGSTEKVRGAASLGLGVAFPSDIGLALNIDLGGKNLGQRQELSVSLGKYFNSLDINVSLGMRNFTMWHDDGSKNNPSAFIAASKLLILQDTIAIFNVGFGNNDFRTITDAAPSSVRVKNLSPFASGAYYLLPQLSLIADYTSGIATLGVGLVPKASWPISVSLGIYDVTKTIPNHNKQSFIASVSSSYTF